MKMLVTFPGKLAQQRWRTPGPRHLRRAAGTARVAGMWQGLRKSRWRASTALGATC
jgi:hypothetical protein